MRTRDLIDRATGPFRHRRLQLAAAAVVLPVGLAAAVLGGSGPAGAHAGTPHGSSTGGTVTYTAKVTIPAPPSSNFSGAAGGGDGWGVALSSTKVYNVFHHQNFIGVNCHNQSDASLCWPSFPYKTISDKVQGNPVSCPGGTLTAGCYTSSGQPGMYFDPASGHLFVFATHLTSGPAGIQGTAGVLCIDTTLAAGNPDPICATNGFTALSAVGDADVTSFNCCSVDYSGISNPQIVGTNWYAFNFYFTRLAAGNKPGAVVATTRNTLLCFSLKTFSACPSQPYTVNFGTAAVLNKSGEPAPSIAAISGRLIIPANRSAAGATGNVLACYDPSVSGGSCGAKWPVAINFSQPSSDGSPFPLLSSTGAVLGFCLPTGTEQCFNLAGTSVATPSNLASVIGGTDSWNGPAVTLGPRVYVPNGNIGNGVVECFDYSKNASCAKFPLAPANLGYLYTVNPDPQRPTCLWVNADDGTAQIQNFDAFTGGQCGRGPIHVLASSFVVPIVECDPTSWTSLQVVQPYPPSTFGGGSVEFEDADGNPLPGVPTTALSSTGFIDLSHFDLSTRSGLPQFVLTLNKPPANLTQVVLVLKWQATYSPSCLQPGTTATPPLTQGYRLEGGDGGIFDYNRPYRGSVGFPSPPGLGLHIFNYKGMALAPDGYWLVQSNGGIFSFHAPFHGSLPAMGITVNNIVGIASTPGGGGYWEVSSNGEVYAFGNAKYLGGCMVAGSPCEGIAPDDVIAIVSPDGGGYWLFGRDGSVFAFGDARKLASCASAGSGCSGQDNFVGAASPDAGGYWLVSSDGGVYAFGDAKYRGSCPATGSACNGTSGVVGIAGPDAGGYWLAKSDGSIYTFGDAKFLGSCRQTGSPCFDLYRPIIAIAS